MKFFLIVAASIFSCSSIYSYGGLPSGSGLYIITATGIMVPGVYHLGKDIIGTITINADNVVLDLNGKSVSGSSANTDRITIAANHSNIVIKNGQLKDGNASPASGIKINSGENIAVSDVVFDNNYFGVFADTSTNVKIESCVFEDHASNSAIRLLNCNMSTIMHNKIMRGTGATAYGIELDASWNNSIQENEINNKIFGIRLANASSNNVIEHNICNQNQIGIFLFTDCNDNKIIGNTCNENSSSTANRGTGIYLHTRCNRNSIQHNQCVGNSSTAASGSSGIYLFGSSNEACLNNVIENNVCSGNTGTASGASAGASGIYINGITGRSGKTIIKNNICQENSGVVSKCGTGVYIDTSNDNLVQDNMCIGNSAASAGSAAPNGGSGIYLNSASGAISGNTIQDNTCIGNSNISHTTAGGTAVRGGSGIYLFAVAAASPNIIGNSVFYKNICTGNVSIANTGSASTGGSGIYLIFQCKNNSIRDNVCTSNKGISAGAGSTVDTGAGILMNTGSSNNAFAGNTCAHNNANTTTSCGISVATNHDDNVLCNNRCRENRTGILVNPSTSERNVVSFNKCDRNETGISNSGTNTKIYYNSAISNTTNYSGVSNTKTQTDLLTTGSFGTNFSGT